MSKTIVIYSKDYCPYCTQAKSLITAKGYSFTEYDIMNDPALTTEMIERSGGRRTVPQIFIGDIHVGGASDLLALERQGTLDALLDSVEANAA